jgi:TATA-box binding protein (TBP) (component of TFIID and TFIIIB)
MTCISNIDQEWDNFNNFEDDNDDDENIDQLNEYLKKKDELNDYVSANITHDFTSEAPVASNIYISTKTVISYLSSEINLAEIFWKIPTINYYSPQNGIIKKQMKFNSTLKSEVEYIQNKLKDETYFEENIITHIDNHDGKIKFKDIRKVSIGMSKKDLLSCRCKKKGAFYNCFVIILRMKIEETFKEFHVKIFNTGKLEIPGIQNEEIFRLTLTEVIKTLQPYFESPLYYKPNSEETVLINSNFNCGYFINREKLYDILKFKYNIQAILDSCSYPGIQCKFYYNPDAQEDFNQNGCQISEINKDKELYKNMKKVSFMIFRTGSVLIVGKCDEKVLMTIYEFLKIILNNEYKNVNQKISEAEFTLNAKNKNKTKKIRRKVVLFDNSN